MQRQDNERYLWQNTRQGKFRSWQDGKSFPRKHILPIGWLPDQSCTMLIFTKIDGDFAVSTEGRIEGSTGFQAHQCKIATTAVGSGAQHQDLLIRLNNDIAGQ